MKFKSLSVVSVIAGCGLASGAFAQSWSESATAPANNVILENLVGGSTKNSPNATNVDYVDPVGGNPPPGETFMLNSAATLGAVTVQGNNDAGYYSGPPDGAFYPALAPSPIASSLQWIIQIGSVSGTTITPLETETVTGFAPTADNDFITFTLARPVSLAAGQEYEFSLHLNVPASNGHDYTWYGLSESLVPVVGGHAFENGAAGGSFGNTVVPITTGSEGEYDYVFVLQSAPSALGITTVGSMPVMVWPASATNYVLQMTTNLASANWVTVTNGIPFIGLQITNAPGAAFFRLH
jgi:hypothetical protein